MDFIEQFGSMPQVHLKKGKILQALNLPECYFFSPYLKRVFFFFQTLFQCPDVSSYSTITISYMKKEKKIGFHRKLEIDFAESNLSWF